MASNNQNHEEIRIRGRYAQESERVQQIEGDALPKDFVSRNQERVKLEYQENDTLELQGCWLGLSSEDRDHFYKNYGRIADLLFIPVQWAKSFIQYWDPVYRCFTLTDADITPTIEEYGDLLKLPLKASSQVYLYNSKASATKKLASILGVPKNTVEAQVKARGETTGCQWSYLKSCFHSRLTEKDNTCRLRILALAIYGLVLIPSASHMIDEAAILLFYEVYTARVNPIPAVLAETFPSLNHCREKKIGQLRCYQQLLYVWIMSHLVESCFTNSYETARNALKEFTKAKWVNLSVNQWDEVAAGITDSSIIWKAKWMPLNSCILKCGSYPWVPLIGARGCISYAPTMVLRQLGRLQYIPCTKGLAEMTFSYKAVDSMEELKEISAAWKEMSLFEEEPGCIKTSKGYPLWQKTRGKSYKVPRVPGPYRPIPLDNSLQDYYEDVWALQEIEYTKLRTEVKNISTEKRKFEVAYEAIGVEKGHLLKKIKKNESINQSLATKLTEADCEINSLHVVITEQSEEIVDLKNQRETLQKACIAFEKYQAELKEENAWLRRNNETLHWKTKYEQAEKKLEAFTWGMAQAARSMVDEAKEMWMQVIPIPSNRRLRSFLGQCYHIMDRISGYPA